MISCVHLYGSMLRLTLLMDERGCCCVGYLELTGETGGQAGGRSEERAARTSQRAVSVRHSQHRQSQSQSQHPSTARARVHPAPATAASEPASKPGGSGGSLPIIHHSRTSGILRRASVQVNLPGDKPGNRSYQGQYRRVALITDG